MSSFHSTEQIRIDSSCFPVGIESGNSAPLVRSIETLGNPFQAIHVSMIDVARNHGCHVLPPWFSDIQLRRVHGTNGRSSEGIYYSIICPLVQVYDIPQCMVLLSIFLGVLAHSFRFLGILQEIYHLAG